MELHPALSKVKHCPKTCSRRGFWLPAACLGSAAPCPLALRVVLTNRGFTPTPSQAEARTKSCKDQFGRCNKFRSPQEVAVIWRRLSGPQYSLFAPVHVLRCTGAGGTVTEEAQTTTIAIISLGRCLDVILLWHTSSTKKIAPSFSPGSDVSLSFKRTSVRPAIPNRLNSISGAKMDHWLQVTSLGVASLARSTLRGPDMQQDGAGPTLQKSCEML
ncbi:hypothetical protein EYF80_004524 [Liparis tanakae]|uniref:Uncharacterized protein n=1 Tax=Liparis tanakae TaxID=230148 RepID=A0A4Z2J5M7_9TELE|nr:hypothetical protein EYF80_004524 [Liparis tanakae]